MRFASFVLACVVAVGCSASPASEPDSAGVADAGAEVAVDAGDDAAADAPADVDRAALCDACVYELCPDFSFCEGAPLRGPGSYPAQDTANGGGRGDCAVHGSGLGGPTLYWLVDVPPGAWTHVVARSLDPEANPLVRVLPDCYAMATETGALGGGTTDGRASLCLRTEGGSTRRVVVAVSRYSPSPGADTLRFDLSVERVEYAEGCPP